MSKLACLLAAGAGFALVCCLTGNSLADSSDGASRLPPSNPGAPIDLGALDMPQAAGSTNAFPCRRYTVDLVWNNPSYSTRYFKFRVDRDGARVYFKMIENPATTMWFLLYGADPNGPIIKPPYIGKDHEEFNEVLPKGTYHLRVVTDAEQRRVNGHNIGQIVVRGLPFGIPDRGQAPPPEQFDRGAVPAGGAVTHRGQLGYISARSMAVPPATNGDSCPFGEASQPVWPRYLRYSEQVTVTAGAGRLLVGLTELRKHNWSRDFRIWRRLGPDGRLDPVQNGQFVHPGGPVTLTISNDANTIPTADMYMDYELRIARP